MNWWLLLIAGLLEVVWAIGLKYTEGFTRPLPSALTVFAMVGSVYLLSLALRTLPVGTAYAVWVGIGAVGTAAVGILVLQEGASPMKLASLALVVGGIVGLKLSSAA